MIRDGTSSTILVAERSPATATCADADNDGLSGLTSLTASLRNVRTGEALSLFFLPATEIDTSGTYAITVRGLTSTELVVEARVRIAGRGFGSFTPGRGG